MFAKYLYTVDGSLQYLGCWLMLSHDDPINHHSMFMLYIIPYANLPLPKNQVIIPNYSVITKPIRKIVGFITPYFTMRLSAAAAASWSAPFWRPCEVLRTSIEFVIARLVGGFNNLEKYEFVNGKDDIPIYEMENNLNHWNHQPVLVYKFINQQTSLGGPILYPFPGPVSSHRLTAEHAAVKRGVALVPRYRCPETRWAP